MHSSSTPRSPALPVAACLAAMLLFSASARAVLISAPELDLSVGASAVATVTAGDLFDSTTSTSNEIAGYDLLLAFDPDVVRIDSVSFSEALNTTDGGPADDFVIEVGAGVLNIGSLNLFGSDFSAQDGGNLDLFDLAVTALAPGTSPLDISPNTLVSGVIFVGPLGQSYAETVVNGEVRVTASPPPTPLPESPPALLAGAALLAALGARVVARTPT